MGLTDYFEIIGDRESGIYEIIEVLKDNSKISLKILGENKQDGLKTARQWLGRELVMRCYAESNIVTHICVKPGRDSSKNPRHEWPVYQYLNGFDSKKEPSNKDS